MRFSISWFGCPWVGVSGDFRAQLRISGATRRRQDEGEVAIGGFGFDPEEVTTLEKGFQKRFGFPVKITHDPTHIRDIPLRLLLGASM